MQRLTVADDHCARGDRAALQGGTHRSGRADDPQIGMAPAHPPHEVNNERSVAGGVRNGMRQIEDESVATASRLFERLAEPRRARDVDGPAEHEYALRADTRLGHGQAALRCGGWRRLGAGDGAGDARVGVRARGPRDDRFASCRIGRHRMLQSHSRPRAASDAAHVHTLYGPGARLR